MSETEPRDVFITTRWRKTETELLEQARQASGAENVSEFIRAAALNRTLLDSIRFDLQKVWGEAIKLSGRVAAIESSREQKATLRDIKTWLALASEVILKLDQKA